MDAITKASSKSTETWGLLVSYSNPGPSRHVASPSEEAVKVRGGEPKGGRAEARLTARLLRRTSAVPVEKGTQHKGTRCTSQMLAEVLEVLAQEAVVSWRTVTMTVTLTVTVCY
ncbi:hypothetical protein AAFF_G00437500 [Aldrovandia affinis]|uniref:Uncharacterized protein n=1 Tax=Aldrovandia affinis TaxID=143900 RepID=A0AAD7S7N2_9TELE|nr:hypothetical protein AAFF_G00437500 [Aldrovandia affinis]